MHKLLFLQKYLIKNIQKLRIYKFRYKIYLKLLILKIDFLLFLLKQLELKLFNLFVQNICSLEKGCV